jgi:hypothetical protein
VGARSIGENIVWIYLPTSLHIIKFLSAAVLHWGDDFLQQLMDGWGLEASLILLLLVQSEVWNCSEFLVFVH